MGRPIKPLRSVPGSQAPRSQNTVIKQQNSLSPSSSKSEDLPKKRVSSPRKKEVLKGPVPSSSCIKELSQVYKRRHIFPLKETSVINDVETPAICEEALPNIQITEVAMKSQAQKHKGKMKEDTKNKIVAEGHHVIMTRKRWKLILPDTSPSLEIDARSKKPVTKDISKAFNLKSHKGKEFKARALRKGKVVEPLQKESLEILSSEDHQDQEANMQPDLSTDAGYDEPDTFNPTSIDFSRARRRLLLPTESNSTEETLLMDEQA